MKVQLGIRWNKIAMILGHKPHDREQRILWSKTILVPKYRPDLTSWTELTMHQGMVLKGVMDSFLHHYDDNLRRTDRR